MPGGKRAIASLKVGDKVTTYDPKTGKTSTQSVEATYLNHDTDLLDVTLRVSASSSSSTTVTAATTTKHAESATKSASKPAAHSHDETIHTTANHPWLTADRGWLVAGKLRVGEPVREADGKTAIVVRLRVVPGSASMWDLTVSNVHTFAVGSGAFVVHNCGDTWQQVKTLSNGETKQQFVSHATSCAFCGKAFGDGDARIIEHAYPRSLARQAAESQEIFDAYVADVDNFSVVCRTCNSIKGAKMPGDFRVVGGGVPGYADALVDKISLIADRYGFPNPLVGG